MTAPARTRTSDDLIRAEGPVLAHNYHPLPVVVARAEGTWVEDVGGRRALAMLSVRATDIVDSILRHDTRGREELLAAGTAP